MGTLLVDEWLADQAAIRVVDQASVSEVRSRVREMGRSAALPDATSEALATAASELAQNQLSHARDGHVAVRRVTRFDHVGLEVIAADRGAGIADAASALAERPRPSGSLGVGLGSVLRLCDEVDFDVRLGEGMCVWARKFQTAPERRSEIAIFARPHPDEVISGDDATFVRQTDGIVLALADGLGHGPDARRASGLAMSVVRQHPAVVPLSLLERCDSVLPGTRGAVMAVAKVELSSRALEFACAGNITADVCSPRAARRLWSSARVLGLGRQSGKIVSERDVLAPGDLLVAFTDGLSARTGFAAEPELRLRHPLVVASELLKKFGRDTDDALIAVLR